jgi:RHS repeat-associated protein
VTYTYDAWARLKTAVTTGSTQYPQWGLRWDYDRFGNRLAQAVTAGTAPSNSVSVDATTNRLLSPYAYDPAGNMTNDGLNTLTYDAESRVVSNTQAGATTNYTYDGNSLRVNKQVSGGTTTVYVFSGTKVVAEYDNGALPSSPSREYIYSRGHLLAKVEAGAASYYHPDHLSARATTNSSGSLVAEQGHYPFGEVWYQGSGGTKWQFTGYERDSESANDYAIFRGYVNRLGRFSSPDSVDGSPRNPQSWNRYGYVLNNAVNLIDPLGRRPRRATFRNSDGIVGGGDNFTSFDPFSGGMMDVIFGYGFFDAIAGAPGTYVHEDIFGNVTWGFSYDLYAVTQNIIDAERTKLKSAGMNVQFVPTTGFQVWINDYGTFTVVSGIVPELAAGVADRDRLLAQIPQAYLDYFVDLVGAGVSPTRAWTIMMQELFHDNPGYAAYWEELTNRMGRTLNDFFALFGHP